MTTPRGTRTLGRPNTAATSPLRAWSAADQMALDHLGDVDLGRVLVVNDAFGAITCGLADAHPTVWTDSATSRQAIDQNLRANGYEPLSPERSVGGAEQPQGEFDTVVVRVPKSSALLEYQLQVVGSVSTPATSVIGAGMVRHVHSSTVAAFEALGPTTTSRAVRKARLVLCEVGSSRAAEVPLPRSEFTTPGGVHVVEHPGTFSAGHVDAGSGLLVESLAARPAPPDGSDVLDVGCGNGVLITSAVRSWHGQTLRPVAIDDSDLAVAATRQTWRRNDMAQPLRTIVADGLGALADDSVDVVVTNPPFHQGHALVPELTDRLLAETARVLRPDGVAHVVVQRHLRLHSRMRRWFASVEVASKHPTHVVLIARNPR